MILKETIVSIVDNSGGRLAKCISLPTYGSHNCARIGDKITVVIMLAKSNKPIKRHQIHKSLVLRTKFKKKRKGVGFFKFDKNAVILLARKDLPAAKRIYGCLLDEFRFDVYYSKIISLTKLIV